MTKFKICANCDVMSEKEDTEEENIDEKINVIMKRGMKHPEVVPSYGMDGVFGGARPDFVPPGVNDFYKVAVKEMPKEDMRAIITDMGLKLRDLIYAKFASIQKGQSSFTSAELQKLSSAIKVAAEMIEAGGANEDGDHAFRGGIVNKIQQVITGGSQELTSGGDKVKLSDRSNAKLLEYRAANHREIEIEI